MLVCKGRRDGADRGEEGLLPDTHAHLAESVFDDDRDAVVERAKEAGVDRILVVGSDLASSREAVTLAHRYPPLYAAVGIHPHEAERFEREANQLVTLLDDEKVVAVGEIGLDYVRSTASRASQLAALSAQVAWARERGLPVSVHNREAEKDIVDVLREAEVQVVLHCFSSCRGFAETALGAGFYLSFAGNLTFPKAGQVREAAQMVPAGRLLVESDAPVLAPQRWRGRRNEPAYTRATLELLAELRGASPEELAGQVSANADRLFGWRAA